MNEYIEISIKTNNFGIEIISAILMEYGAETLQIENRDDINKLIDNKARWSIVDDDLANIFEQSPIVKGYFLNLNDETVESIKFKINEMKSEFDIGSCEMKVNTIKNNDWTAEFKKYFVAEHISENVIICPAWEEVEPKEDEIVIKIDPGTAFGTGKHATTRLCIDAIMAEMDNSKTMLDVGCGSGILSVAAFKNGAKRVCAVDIDELAVEATQKMCVLNDINLDNIDIIHGDLVEKVNDKYDVVVANILIDAIKILLPDVKNVLQPDGVFIASGILADQAEEAEKAFIENGYNVIKTEYMTLDTSDEWCAIYGRIGD